MNLGRANYGVDGLGSSSTNVQVRHEKPTVRGPSPSRKAHLALREKLNRKIETAVAIAKKKRKIWTETAEDSRE